MDVRTVPLLRLIRNAVPIIVLALTSGFLSVAAARGGSLDSVVLAPSRVFHAAGEEHVDAFAVDGQMAAVWTSQNPIQDAAPSSNRCGGGRLWNSTTGAVRGIALKVPCQDLRGIYLALDPSVVAVLALYAPPMSADEVDDVLWTVGWRPPTRQALIYGTATTAVGGIHSFAVRGGNVVHDRWNEPVSGSERPIGLYRGHIRIARSMTGHILSFDGTRLLVLTPKRQIVLLTVDGARLHTFGRADDALLDGDSVVTYARGTLSVWSASRGTMLRHWQVAAARGSNFADDPSILSGLQPTVDLAVGGGYAAFFPKAASRYNYPTWRGPFWIVRLSDGKARQVTVSKIGWPWTVRLDAEGLFARSSNAIAFVPRRSLDAAFS